MSRQFNFQLTLNNSTEEERQKLIDELFDLGHSGAVVLFFVGATEKAPTTGMEHNHVFVCFEEKHSIKEVKDHFSNKTIHIEATRGDETDNRKYASKDGNIIVEFKAENKEIHDNIFKDQKTTDSEQFSAFIKDCRECKLNEEELITKYPDIFIKYQRAFFATIDRYNRAHNEIEYRYVWETIRDSIIYGTGSRDKLIEEVDKLIDHLNEKKRKEYN